MTLFSEKATITKIHSVMCYGPDNQPADEWRSFGVPFCYELVYYLDGVNDTYFQGQVFRCESDCMLLLPKAAKNPGYRVHRLSPFVGRCIDIYFETDSPMPDVATHFRDCGAEMRSRFSKLYHTWFAKSRGYYPQAMAQFYQIIALHLSHEQAGLPHENDRRLQAASAYITQHYLDADFDYQALAQAAGLSYSYFKKLFTDLYRVPPVKYVTRLRMDYARELLITGKYSVSEVAELCGYSEAYYFSAVFKRVFGISPSACKANKTTLL